MVSIEVFRFIDRGDPSSPNLDRMSLDPHAKLGTDPMFQDVDFGFKLRHTNLDKNWT